MKALVKLLILLHIMEPKSVAKTLSKFNAVTDELYEVAEQSNKKAAKHAQKALIHTAEKDRHYQEFADAHEVAGKIKALVTPSRKD